VPVGAFVGSCRCRPLPTVKNRCRGKTARNAVFWDILTFNCVFIRKKLIEHNLDADVPIISNFITDKAGYYIY